MISNHDIASEAKDGFVYVCMVCGKRSKDIYGEKAINHGWDESCALWASEIEESRLVIQDGLVVEIKDKK